jgi:hypothetical protein
MLLLVAALVLSGCGIIGGSSKKDESKAFCERATTAEAAGVLGTVDGTETAEQLRAYEANQEAVDYLGEHAPAKIEQTAQDLVTAYDELVTELARAELDTTKVDAATLADLNGRLEDALAAMATGLKNQCDITVGT